MCGFDTSTVRFIQMIYINSQYTPGRILLSADPDPLITIKI
jgi:hypothetical protein